MAPPNARAEKTMTFATHLREGSSSYVFLDKIMTEAFSRLGMKFVLKVYPAKRALEMADCGLTDGEALRLAGLEKDYPSLIQIPVALKTISTFVYSQQNLELSNGWDDLKELTAVILRGSVLATNLANHYCKRVEKVNTHILQLRFLTSKRADILIVSPRLIEPLLQLDEFKDQGIRKIAPALSTIKLYPYLHKKHKDMVIPLTRALQEMMSDGTYDLIIKDLGESTEDQMP